MESILAAGHSSDIQLLISVASAALSVVFGAWVADERHNRHRLETEMDKERAKNDHLTQMFIEVQKETIQTGAVSSAALTRAGEAVTRAEDTMTKQALALAEATAEIRNSQFYRQALREGGK